ncbi:hypothetical protein [Ruminococcus flavefaciens]|uniref:hypothetical protein n=1 Tax=Ruminococcus flavefaciens TaxID=1265 RepID=UPI0026ED5000|nr:hypothetical protein [Ruminococcus flavefaciens]MBQ6213124.1 hypothetical protein [Ruminococcus sp.]
MVEQDTIKLLRECDAGVKMGISSIGDVISYVSSHDLKRVLQDSSQEHDGLKSDLQGLLGEYHDEGKEPAAMAKGMSWVKTNVKLKMNESDSTVADLITDGCNMGIKSLSRYLNKYQAADERSKDLAKRIISAEEKLGTDVRAYL